MSYKKQFLLYGLITAVTFVLVQGCMPAKPIANTKALTVPGSFTGKKDSATIAAIPWRKFFKDRTLVGLIDTALRNNLNLQNTLHRISVARANLLQAKGLKLPSVEGFISAAADKYGKYTMTGVGNFDTNLSPNVNNDQKVTTSPTQDYFLGIKSTWEIDIWGKLKARKTEAADRLLATEMGRQWVVTQLVAEVAGLYYELLARDKKLEIIKRNIRLQEQGVEIVKAQMEGGRATSLAVQQFNAQLVQTKGLQLETELDIIKLENQVNLLLGKFPGQIPRGDSINRQPVPDIVQAGIPSQLLAQRPDIREAELLLEASKANTTAVRKAFLPSLVLTPYLAFSAFKLPLLFADGSLTYGLLGGITQPVFNRNQLKSNYNIATAEQQIAFNNYQQNILQAFGEVMSSLQSIEQYRKIVTVNQEEVQTLTNAVVTSNDLYKNGYASYLEVITAQKGVLDAELNKTLSQKEMQLSLLNLYRSLGGGWQ